VRRGSGGDQVVRGLDPTVANRDRGARDEPGITGEQLDAVVGGEVEVLLLTQPAHDLVLTGDQRAEVDRARLGANPRKALLGGAVARLGGGQQRLGRDASPR
jgi:hypothetical protein